jgi:hypothetical protein
VRVLHLAQSRLSLNALGRREANQEIAGRITVIIAESEYGMWCTVSDERALVATLFSTDRNETTER